MGAGQDIEIARLRSALKGAQGDVERLTRELDQARAACRWHEEDKAELKTIAELRVNLDAFADSWHILAGRLEEGSDPKQEAGNIRILADQMHTCVGLTPRDKRAA